jgi:hypothetical protein
VVRFRPLNENEIKIGSKIDYRIANNSLVYIKQKGAAKNDKPHEFAFDHAFDTQTEQEHFYTITAQPVVKQIFEGLNGTILAYGQTGSGKTFTMQGGLTRHPAGPPAQGSHSPSHH